jgi:hypothetical protein
MTSPPSDHYGDTGGRQGRLVGGAHHFEPAWGDGSVPPRCGWPDPSPPTNRDVRYATAQWSASGQFLNALVDDIDLSLTLCRAQRLELLARAQHAQGFTRCRIIDDAMHGAAQAFPRFIKDRIMQAIKTTHHMHALIQVGIDLASVTQHDGRMRLVLEEQRHDPVLPITQISARADSQLALLSR